MQLMKYNIIKIFISARYVINYTEIVSSIAALPWINCENIWNQESCVTVSELPNILCSNDSAYYNNSDRLLQPSAFNSVDYLNTTSSNETKILRDPSLHMLPLISQIDFNEPQERNESVNSTSVFRYWQLGAHEDFHCQVNDVWIRKEDITEPVREFWE